MKKIICFIGWSLCCLLAGCSIHRELVGKDQLIKSSEKLLRITVFLPLSGPMANVGVTLQRAILTAHYSLDRPVDLLFLDENENNLSSLYQEALLRDSQLIIGPLAKNKIEELLKIEKLDIPVIALNTLDDYKKNYRKNLYQFGLFPEDEVKQLAKQINYFQFRCLGVVVVNEDWGKKLVSIFRKNYHLPIELSILNGNKNFSEQICSFLANETLELCNVKERMKKRGTEEEYLMRRQDLEGILVLADNLQARQILPLLKFYYADNLPVFMISNVYEGVNGKHALSDLDGAYFCDIPWNLHSSLLSKEMKQIYRQIVKIWGKGYGDQSRLYALGIDAYLIAYHFYEFLSQKTFLGSTGKIYLDQYNHFYRELTWVQIKNNRLEIQQ